MSAQSKAPSSQLPENDAFFQEARGPDAEPVPGGGPKKKDDKANKRRKPRKLRKLSADYFRRAALYYLERHNGSQHSLRQVLRRRVMRAEREGQELDREEVEAWIETVIKELVAQGFLDDARFALTRARSLYDRGQSTVAIRMKLRAKGVAPDLIDEALERLREEQNHESEADMALDAARAYARKRGLGWHRLDPQVRAERAQKDLAALARRGFGYQVARQALEEGLDEGERLDDLPDDWE